MIARWSLGFSCLIIFISTGLFAETKTAQQDLIDRISALKTLKADFTQTVVGERGRLIQKTSGRFFLKRPRQFRWQTEKPFKQLLMSNNNDELWTYEEELAQATVRPFKESIVGTPLEFIIEPEKTLKDSVQVSKVDELGLTRFNITMTGKKVAESIDAVEITFNKKHPDNMLIRDKLGRKTVIQFSRALSNPVLLDNLFEYSFPKGTDIIRQN